MIDNGIEYLELEYQYPVYISAIAIYEVQKPGSVLQVLITDQYSGNTTTWTRAWLGNPAPGIVDMLDTILY